MAFPLIGAILGSSIIGGVAANSAAKKQAGAANKSLGVQQDIYNQTRTDLMPYQTAGGNALRMYADEVTQPFTTSPGYQFRLNQGLDAIEASAAARGGLFSGATGQALNAFAQDYASNEYANYMRRLEGMTGMGQAAAAGQAAAGQNYANAASGAYNAIGNAGSAGAMAIGNQAQNALTNYIGDQQFKTLLDQGYFKGPQ